ncbi:hypothetical protein INT45_014223 [Circinella minor]|uniref:Ubiquitin-like domain-containing protein n=1 Tax=Circinella minor TaxID=1195481 RepID=A0A8H7VTG6_9FUNG|nr:hypothetical protein INT45_014223 [Circinella minor]
MNINSLNTVTLKTAKSNSPSKYLTTMIHTKKIPIYKGSNPIKIYVKRLVGDVLTIYIDVETENVYKLKEAIKEVTDNPPDQMRVIYKEKHLISGSPRRLEFSRDAPKGRMVNSGTNIEVECECTPSYPVIYAYGMGLYELDELKPYYSYPNCSSRDVKLITAGFTNCQYRIHGVKE